MPSKAVKVVRGSTGPGRPIPNQESKIQESTVVPWDEEAEESLLAGVVRSPTKVADLAFDVEPMDFYKPQHQKLWLAWERFRDDGEKVDALSWAREADVDTEFVTSLIFNDIGFNRNHVELIKRNRLARDIAAICTDAKFRVLQHEDPYEIAEELDFFASTAGHSDHNEVEAVDIYELAEGAGADSPEIIPGLLRQDWRAIITGGEGTGKGTLLRSFALSTAAGYHPLTHNRMKRRRTLLIDLENPKAAILETGQVLADTLMRQSIQDGGTFESEWCKIWYKPAGIDIRNRQDKAAMIREIAAHRPELVCIGPAYKLARPQRGDNWEDAALGMLAVLDELRVKYGFALMLEAHSPNANGGQRRELRPMGSVYLTAWPELGIGLRPDNDNPLTLNVEHFRGARLKQQWPQRIIRDPRWIISGGWDRGRVSF